MNEELINAIRKDIGPLRIAVTCDLVDHVYYLTFDGNRTYPTEKYWYEKWGKNFSEVVAMFLKHHLHKSIDPKDIQVINGACVRVRVGSVFDIVKDISL